MARPSLSATETESVVGFDHVAITVADIDVTCRFYERVLGARVEADYKAGDRTIVRQVRVGGALLNIHQQGNGLDLVAARPTPGSADLCFRWGGTAASAKARLDEADVPLREGPVPRTSSDGQAGESVYFFDPDGNLIELLAAPAAS